MKAITSLAAVSFGIIAITSSAFAKAPEGWQTDFDKALEIAGKENKALMLEFTGSDWCPPCIMMKKKVFSKPEFFKQASKDYVLVHLDFPKADKTLAEKNQPLADQFKIESFPTIILLDAKGKEFERFFASEYDEISSFISHLKASLDKKELD